MKIAIVTTFITVLQYPTCKPYGGRGGNHSKAGYKKIHDCLLLMGRRENPLSGHIRHFFLPWDQRIQKGVAWMFDSAEWSVCRTRRALTVHYVCPTCILRGLQQKFHRNIYNTSANKAFAWLLGSVIVFCRLHRFNRAMKEILAVYEVVIEKFKDLMGRLSYKEPAAIQPPP